ATRCVDGEVARQADRRGCRNIFEQRATTRADGLATLTETEGGVPIRAGKLDQPTVAIHYGSLLRSMRSRPEPKGRFGQIPGEGKTSRFPPHLLRLLMPNGRQVVLGLAATLAQGYEALKC